MAVPLAPCHAAVLVPCKDHDLLDEVFAVAHGQLLHAPVVLGLGRLVMVMVMMTIKKYIIVTMIANMKNSRKFNNSNKNNGN